MGLQTDLIEDTTKVIQNIRQRIETVQSRQKSYAVVHRGPLEFDVGDTVFLKVAYELELPQEMSSIHNVFHVSMLKKHVPNAKQVIEPQMIHVQEDLSYENRPIQIIDWEVKKLRNKEILLVKVL
ncbi:uncharacterized protein LOC121978235 [Zingiber officinale]|uniref:uncharacterized protein LOC121978235 n=1 Tax=Zingiber officinale TaxID=94328 RepID=UPI001C4BB026|nr:uncharacterized protein LOC121978235 [Zingiber officinale]